MHRELMDWLVCPACQGALKWQIVEETPTRVVQGKAVCTQCGADYPIRDEIALFLTADLPRDDWWAQVDSTVGAFFRANPELEKQLLETALENLNPADTYLRGRVLEERDNFSEAVTIGKIAFRKLYTTEYLAIHDKFLAQLANAAVASKQPIVDLASGRGYLVEELLLHEARLVVATDFSPMILRRNQAYFRHLRLYDHLSLVACDARRMPFKNGSIPLLTTFVGLPNIGNAETVLPELRRIVNGSFWSINTFYPTDDEPNWEAIRQRNLEVFHDEALFKKAMANTNWQIVSETCETTPAEPTPRSEIVQGLGIDGLPVAPAQIIWSLIEAH